MNALLFESCVLLAQNGGAAPAAPPGPSPYGMLFPLAAIGLVFYLMLIRPQRREQQTRQKLLEGLKKNDRVVTVGGIYGVVLNVRREADEVTLKVDESSNTKLRVTVSSISRILGDEAGETKPNS